MSTGEILAAIDDAIRTGDLTLQAQVNTQGKMTNWRWRLCHLALEVDVPAALRIWRETAGLDDALDRTRQPQAEAVPTIGNGIVLEPDIGGFEGYPAQGALFRAPLELDLFTLASSCHVLGTDLLDSISREMQVFGGPSSQFVQVIGRQKLFVPTPHK